MHFHRITRKRAEVPIVPMIDILFILLVFFIVSTTFKKPRNVLRIEIPTVREIPSDQVADARSVIAVALNTTIFGLAIAVPCVVAHGYFTRRIEVLTARLESLLADLAHACQKPSTKG